MSQTAPARGTIEGRNNKKFKIFNISYLLGDKIPRKVAKASKEMIMGIEVIQVRGARHEEGAFRILQHILAKNKAINTAVLTAPPMAKPIPIAPIPCYTGWQRGA